MERNPCIRDVLELDMPRHEPAQSSVGDKVVAPPAQAADGVRMLTGKMSSRCEPHQARASSLAVGTVCGRDAKKAAFSAPADVPTNKSAAIPLS